MHSATDAQHRRRFNGGLLVCLLWCCVIWSGIAYAIAPVITWARRTPKLNCLTNQVVLPPTPP
jgi:hypothetical protein